MSSSGSKPVSFRGADDRVATTLGRFRLTEKIGEGGMGVVYRATVESGGDAVAIKLLGAEHTSDEARRKRFLREARVMAALEHPGIARVIEIGEAEGVVFIAMELVRGRSLRARLDARAEGDSLSVEGALGLARRIAEAVAYAHEKGVVHRDLKPDNVMVEGDGNVRVLDFGLAKLRETSGGMLYEAETETSMTKDGHVLGTPAYMAPEQATGKDVSFRADVFSLGVILYEMLAEERPFVGASAMEVIIALTRDDPALPSTKNPGVSAELDRLVMRCLAKKPEDRPTMPEIMAALDAPAVRASHAPAKATKRPFFAVAVIAAVGVASIFAWRASSERASATTASSTSLAQASASAPPPAPTTLLDLPLPASSIPDALAAYKDAIREERDGAEDGAMDRLTRATDLDPEMAAAHLRLALRLAFVSGQDARTHFVQAAKLIERLSPRDKELLDACRPLFQRDPPDVIELSRRVTALSARYPGDAELAFEEGMMLGVLGDFRTAAEASARAMTIDPKFGLALSQLGENQAYSGDLEGARATSARCLEIAPNGEWCFRLRDALDSQVGACDKLEASARDRIAGDPTVPDGYKALVLSIASTNRPESAVREAIGFAVARFSNDASRHRYAVNQGLRIDALFGNFTAASAHATEIRKLDASRPDTGYHAYWALTSAEIENEMGHTDDEVRIASEFLDRKEAWEAAPVLHDYSLSDDMTPVLLSIVHRVKKTPNDAYEDALATWRKRWDTGLHGGYKPYLWVYGYAPLVETEDEARAALSALPAYSPIPPFIPNGNEPMSFVGRALWLGGRRDEGIDALTKAAAMCGAGSRPVAWVRAHAWLGDALAARGGEGDKERACAAYDLVIARWGNAKPRSVTAEHVRKARATLGCANAP